MNGHASTLWKASMLEVNGEALRVEGDEQARGCQADGYVHSRSLSRRASRVHSMVMWPKTEADVHGRLCCVSEFEYTRI